MERTHLRLAEYCDGRLSGPDAEAAATHLDACRRCQEAVADFRFAATMVARLAIAAPPETVWHGIDAALRSLEPARQPIGDRSRARLTPVTWRRWQLAAAALILAALGGSYWYLTSPRDDRWPVVRVTGAATVQALAVGEVLQTDGASRLRLTVGAIGSVDVEPNTRIRLLSARSAEQRLTLELGTITATISAPPRLFFVNTPSSTVVDLGCKYTMRVDEQGAGSLHVAVGWASLEWDGRESLVPAGASCTTRPQSGPGTPSFDDATPALRSALAAFDFDNGSTRALDIVLGESRARDTLTLWHLLSRVDSSDRRRVFDRMVALAPLPSGVTEEKALQLDGDTLKRWREELAWTW